MAINKRKIDGFIYSSPRSGSTVLRLNLNKLDRVIALPETHFFAFIKEHSLKPTDKIPSSNNIFENWLAYHTTQKLIKDQSKLLKDLQEGATEVLDIIEITIANFLVENSVDDEGIFILEKSPPHIYFQDAINDVYPNAKNIYLVRDPRDVAASLKYCNWSTSNVYTNAKLWSKGVQQIRTGLEIRYEDLVDRPDEMVKQVADYLEVNFDEDKVKAATLDSIEQKNYSSTNSFKPISNTFVGNFNEKLSKPDREIEIIEHVAKTEMKKYGYTPVGKSRDLRFRINKSIAWMNYMFSRIT